MESGLKAGCIYLVGLPEDFIIPTVIRKLSPGGSHPPIVLSYPAGIVARGIVIYIAEHPSLYQGAIRMSYLLKGLVKLQLS